MGKIAFVFAGQGAQSPGMGKDVYDAVPAVRDIFAKADAGRPGTSAQCFEADADELMPPKSTWFDPKLLSGLALRRIW